MKNWSNFCIQSIQIGTLSLADVHLSSDPSYRFNARKNEMKYVEEKSLNQNPLLKKINLQTLKNYQISVFLKKQLWITD
jgi:hypothetical protein